MLMTMGRLRVMLAEVIGSQIRVRDEVVWSGDSQTYEVRWGASASKIDDTYDLPDSERTGLKGGTPVPSNWYAYISHVKSGKGRYVPVAELSPSSADVDPRLVEHFRQYVSDPFDPKYAIRFVEKLSEVPDAERVGYHDTVPNGVYAFVFTEDVYQMLIGNDVKAMGVYFEDIMVPMDYGFIMKCNLKRPLFLDGKSWAAVYSMAQDKGHVATQRYLLEQGYDSIVDPHVLIEYEIPQVCFLTNDSFQVVEKLVDLKPA